MKIENTMLLTWEDSMSSSSLSMSITLLYPDEVLGWVLLTAIASSWTAAAIWLAASASAGCNSTILKTN